MSRRVFFLLCLFVAIPLFAQERRYTVGTTVDLVGGSTNYLNGNLAQNQQNRPFFYFYGAYPSLNVVSTGAHSVVTGSYSLGLSRAASYSNLRSDSHSFSLRFSQTLSEHLKINIAEAFQVTDDASTFNAFRGVTPSPEDFRFIFNPVTARLTSRNNNTSFVTDYTLDDKSSISFTGSHSFLNYGNAQTLNFLSDQQRLSGGMTYNRKTSPYETWSVGYTVNYFDYANPGSANVSFQNSLSQVAHVGYSTRVGRDLNLQFSVGASQTQDLVSRQSYVGYNTSASFGRTIQNNSFSLFYNQTSGESIGLGSISNTRTAGISVNRAQKNLNIYLNASAFETVGTLANTLNARGVQGAATIGIPLSSRWAVQGGVQYQQYDHSSPIAVSQKRVFMSLRYTNPDLFKFLR